MNCKKCNHEVHEDSQGIITCLSCGYREEINQVRDTTVYNNKDLMKREPTNDAGEKLQYSTSFCNTCKEVTQDGERKAEDGTKWCTSCLSYKDGRMRVHTNDAGEDPINPSHYTSFTIAPNEYITANSLEWEVGNIIKYVSRYHLKNGLEDLRKAQKYIELLIDRKYYDS